MQVILTGLKLSSWIFVCYLNHLPFICLDNVNAKLSLLKIRVRQAGQGLCERLSATFDFRGTKPVRLIGSKSRIPKIPMANRPAVRLR
jgi:hypothetical protein